VTLRFIRQETENEPTLALQFPSLRPSRLVLFSTLSFQNVSCCAVSSNGPDSRAKSTHH
jgi:hypothetical protein